MTRSVLLPLANSLSQLLFSERDFYMSLMERFSEYVRACFTGLWIESHEHQDALIAIAQLCHQEHWRLAT